MKLSILISSLMIVFAINSTQASEPSKLKCIRYMQTYHDQSLDQAANNCKSRVNTDCVQYLISNHQETLNKAINLCQGNVQIECLEQLSKEVREINKLSQLCKE